MMRSLWRGAQDMNRNYRDRIITLNVKADLHAHLLQMLGAKDHIAAGRIIGELHTAQRFVQDCRRPIPNWKVMLMVAAFLLGGFLVVWSHT